jgi:Rrf2 family protein
MFKLNKKTEYGLLALETMMSRTGDPLVTAKEIADTHRIPHPLLAKILQKLVRHHIIQSIKGVRGGYVLTRDPDEITLADVVEALEGPIRITECRTDFPCCDRIDFCTLKDRFQPVQDHLVDYFKTLTLADLIGTTQPSSKESAL